jgi:alpha-1,3-rhamnosyl/mannosyltransferase
MGMGHAEKMLVEHLLPLTNPLGWELEMVFSGRSPESPAAHAKPNGVRSSFLGFSAARLHNFPLSFARAATRFGSGVSAPSLYHSLAVSYPVPKCAPAIYTIHDLPPARFSDEGQLPVWTHRAAQSAEAIITPSAFGKAEVVDILEVAPERVHVVPNGVEHDLFSTNTPETTQEQLSRYGLSKPFLIYVGGFTQRKNVKSLLSAWKKLAPKYPSYHLALVGLGPQLEKLRGEGSVPQSVVIGHLGRPQIAALMKAAEAVVVPSVYEGFGLPALEGMALGVPVVAVRSGAIPEVVGDAALLVGDGSAEKLAEGIEAVIKDQQLAAILKKSGPTRARQFSWKDQAQAVLEIYKRVLG